MKYLIFLLNMAMLSPAVYTQPVAKADLASLLNAIPAAPTSLAEAYERTYNGAAIPNGQAWYRANFDQL